MYNNKNTEALLDIHPDELPVSLQIFGSEPDIMAETAKRQTRGKQESKVRELLNRHILIIARTPSNSASKNIIMPQPKHS